MKVSRPGFHQDSEETQVSSAHSRSPKEFSLPCPWPPHRRAGENSGRAQSSGFCTPVKRPVVGQSLKRGPSAGGLLQRRGLKADAFSLDDKAWNVQPGINEEGLEEVSHGSTHYHGTRSGCLVAFHPTTPVDVRGALLPMGHLREHGAAVLSGERGYSLEDNAFNHRHLSVVDKTHFGSAYHYATNEAHQPLVKPLQTQGRRELAESFEKAHKRIASDPDLKNLVDPNFPVVFGVKPTFEQLQPIDSSVAGEVGVKGGVSAENIASLLVPDEHVEPVDQLLKGLGYAIPVEPFSKFKQI